MLIMIVWPSFEIKAIPARVFMEYMINEFYHLNKESLKNNVLKL